MANMALDGSLSIRSPSSQRCVLLIKGAFCMMSKTARNSSTRSWGIFVSPGGFPTLAAEIQGKRGRWRESTFGQQKPNKKWQIEIKVWISVSGGVPPRKRKSSYPTVIQRHRNNHNFWSGARESHGFGFRCCRRSCWDVPQRAGAQGDATTTPPLLWVCCLP